MAARRALLPLARRRLALAAPSLRHSSSSSTSALAYKAIHRKVSPLPTDTTPAWSASAAVSSILYETPVPAAGKPHRHVLNCLVQNEPGVLARVSNCLASRGFNIDSLVVCHTEVADLSRMTIVIQGQDVVVEQARRQLEDLVPVWAVLDYTETPLVQRELLLAKISILGPEYFQELLAYHQELAEAENEAVATAEDGLASHQAREAVKHDFHPSKLVPSEALRHKHRHLEAITYLTHQFKGKVLDISNNNCIVELSAKPARVDSFLKLIEPFGILESARTGQ
jgi:acetolactate synthase-1/3 small subunit